ncbi:MAG: nucleotidyltransferase family protein [Rhodobacteraceae bacterium]|nr:nucleotidyltransferase family protein [Paracoccaceae bacterium]
MPDAVMLFAAGFGTRMAPLTRNIPKPLIQIAGRSLLEHALVLADAARVPRRVVNTHYLGEQIADAVKGRDVMISHEASQILDTGGGLKAALPLLQAPEVFTMNTDAVWHGPNPLEVAKAAWRPAVMDALLVCVAHDRAVGRLTQGDFLMTRDGHLSRGPGLVYTGVQILKTDAVSVEPQEVFSLNLIWDRMLASGRLFGVIYPGTWCDVGHPGGIPLAENMLRGADV